MEAKGKFDITCREAVPFSVSSNEEQLLRHLELNVKEFPSRRIIDEYFESLLSFLGTELTNKLRIPDFIVDWVKKETVYVLKDGADRDSAVIFVDKMVEITSNRRGIVLQEGDIAKETRDLLGLFGWCLVLLENFYEMQDDIVEGVKVRNGKPAWHTLPEAQSTWIQDAFFLEQLIYLLLTHILSDDEELFTIVIRLVHSVIYNVALVQFTKNRQKGEYSGEYARVKHLLFRQRLPQTLAYIVAEKIGKNEEDESNRVPVKYSFVEGCIQNLFNPENTSPQCLVL